MKIRFILSLFAVTLCLAACDEKANVTDVTGIAGTYEGYTDADCSYFQNRYTDNESLKITADDNGTVSVVFESVSWGIFNVVSAAVTEEGGKYVITGSGKITMGMGESSSDYDFTMAGSVVTPKESFSITFTVPGVMGGLTITLLPGVAPARDAQ